MRNEANNADHRRTIAESALPEAMTHESLNPVEQVLKPCPFCGGEPQIEPKNWAGRDFIGVFCTECLIFQDSRSATVTDAIAAWNTRPERALVEAANAVVMDAEEFGILDSARPDGKPIDTLAMRAEPIRRLRAALRQQEPSDD